MRILSKKHFAVAAALAFSMGGAPTAFSASKKGSDGNLLCFLTTTLVSGGEVETTTRQLSVEEAKKLGATVDRPISSRSGKAITTVDCLDVTELDREKVDWLKQGQRCIYNRSGQYQCN